MKSIQQSVRSRPLFTASAPRSRTHARHCATAAATPKLIVYTKPDCPLCDGLKDKVAGLVARAQFMPSLLSSYTFEARDVSTNEEWATAYAHEVPVLATEEDGRQVVLLRPLPRITAEKLQRHIEAALLEAQ